MTSGRAVCTSFAKPGLVSVYVFEERLEVGRTDLLCNERLTRVAFRDARRLVAWTATRTWSRWLGAVVGVLGLVLAASALVSGLDRGSAVALLVWGGCGLALGAWLVALGRPGGITRFRLEGARGAVEGVLAGSRRRRAAILAEIEDRIRSRQERHGR